MTCSHLLYCDSCDKPCVNLLVTGTFFFFLYFVHRYADEKNPKQNQSKNKNDYVNYESSSF